MNGEPMKQDNCSSSRRTIMAVDDAEYILVTVRRVFERENIDVLTATGATGCLQHLQEGFRGVILMDVMMPGKDGWETIREIDAAGMLQGNIIIMLTGMDSPGQGMEGLQEIVADYITKPFTPHTLVSTVQKYLDCLDQASEARSN